VFQSKGIIYDQKITVIALDSFSAFSVLCSHLHHWWVIRFGSSLRTDAVYTPSDCFETFPFPGSVLETGDEISGPLSRIGQEYDQCRSKLMIERQEGLTTTYNRFHDPIETSADIQKLRELHVEMDAAVAAAYGWTDLVLDHGFHQTKQGVRYTISEIARREVLARLLKLNHERYAEEVKQGLHEKKKPKATKGKKQPKSKSHAGPSLFQNEEDDDE
jgi:hypothetical protein